MRPRGPARAVQHKVTRVIATFHRHPADGVDHVVVDDVEHAVSGLFHRQSQGVSDTRLNCVTRLLRVQRQAPAHQPIGVDITQNKVGIGGCGLCAALVIGRRAGFRPSRLRAHLHQAHRVNPPNRPATRAQRFHLNHRNADAVAQEVDVLGHIGPPIPRQRDVKRRAAHVDRDDILQPPRFRDIKCCLRGRGGARVDRINRLV